MPSHQPRRQAEEQLSRAWDALTRGIPPDPASIDPSLVETMRRLQALGEHPRPDPAFADHLEDDLTRAMTSSLVLLTTARALTNLPNGRLALISPPPPPPRLGSSRRRWALAQLATAALILLTLLGSILSLRVPLPLVSLVQHPAIIPAIDDTPESTLPSGITEDTIIFHQTFEDIPPAAAWARVERDTLGPGTTWLQGTPGTSGVGPMLYRVEAGQVSLRAAGPMTLTRAGETAPVEVPKSTDVILSAGDVVYLRSGVSSTWRNDGPPDATLMGAGITTNGLPPTIPQTTPINAAINAGPVAPPAAPAELTVHRLILAPGASMPNGPESSLKLVGVESGVMTGTRATRAAPTIDISTDQYRAGSWVNVNRDDYILNELRNDSSEPLILLVMTVAPAAQSAPSASVLAPAAIPGASEDTVLMQGRFDTIPSLANWQGIARAILPPGVEWPLGKSENDGEGPLLYHIEFGELTVNADGPIQVTRARTSQPITIPPGQDVVLQKGDQGFTPSGVTSRWRNARQVPVVVLDAGFSTSSYGALPDGVTDDAVAWTYASRPKGSVAVSVRRVTLPAGAVLAASDLPGLQLLYVESGTIEVVDVKHLATTANPLLNTPPDKAARTIGVGSFYSAADHAGSVVRVTNAESATLLIMTVVNTQSGEAPPMS